MRLFFVFFTFILAMPSFAEDAMYGHLPYVEAAKKLRVKYENIFLHKDAKKALLNLINSAKKDGVTLKVISGFRSIKRQHYLFYDIAKKRGQTLEERAKVSAPPKYSEHHTGFAFDFDDGDNPVLLEKSFAKTKAGKWLKKHAVKHGFELSFPKNNTQGILYEPWHWRWVGNRNACHIFKTARQKYPSSHMALCL